MVLGKLVFLAFYLTSNKDAIVHELMAKLLLKLEQQLLDRDRKGALWISSESILDFYTKGNSLRFILPSTPP